MKIYKQPILVLVGPTAIGKTALSLKIAEKFNCEIISMDSMQIFKHMDIGTAKITKEEQGGIPHHLLDMVNPDEAYDASSYCDDALLAIEDIQSRGKLPLITGGTGLYLQSLCHGFFDGPKIDEKVRADIQAELEEQGGIEMHRRLSEVDPDSAERIHPNDSYRVSRALEVYKITGEPWSRLLRKQEKSNRFTNILKIGLTMPREKLYERINYRTELMLSMGLEQEVKNLLDMGYSRELNSMGSIGYKHMANYLAGDWSYEEMQTLLARDTRRYAKRQYTWFNKVDDLLWHEVAGKAKVLDSIDDWYGK